jgi:hypothetical protein
MIGQARSAGRRKHEGTWTVTSANKNVVLDTGCVVSTINFKTPPSVFEGAAYAAQWRGFLQLRSLQQLALGSRRRSHDHAGPPATDEARGLPLGFLGAGGRCV